MWLTSAHVGDTVKGNLICEGDIDNTGTQVFGNVGKNLVVVGRKFEFYEAFFMWDMYFSIGRDHNEAGGTTIFTLI